MAMDPAAASALVFASLVIPMVLMLGVNVVMGIVSVSMAKKRGLNTVPAFFAGFFGSFIALFFIAMFPKSITND
jgi:hypothetical protein